MNNEYFLSINEVSKRLDLPAYTLRYWEKQFPVKIKPTTGAGGRRYYRAETVSALEKIKDLLYNRGMTLAGVKKMIKEGDFDKSTTNNQESDSEKFIGKMSDDGSYLMTRISVNKTVSQNRLFSHSDDITTAIDLLERAKKELK